MNKEERKEYDLEYREKNKEKIRVQRKKYCEEHKEDIKKYMEEYRQKPEVKKRRKKWCVENPEKVKTIKKKYYKKHKDEIKSYATEYQKEYQQRPEVRERIRKTEKKKFYKNSIYRLKKLIRGRVHTALTKYSKTGKIMKSKEYGINYKKIIEYLKPFPKDIDNYEVDHIIPLSWFDFNNPKEIKWAFSPENHQWLLKEENRKKRNNFMG